jgi:hypothetical protein
MAIKHEGLNDINYEIVLVETLSVVISTAVESSSFFL